MASDAEHSFLACLKQDLSCLLLCCMSGWLAWNLPGYFFFKSVSSYCEYTKITNVPLIWIPYVIWTWVFLGFMASMFTKWTIYLGHVPVMLLEELFQPSEMIQTILLSVLWHQMRVLIYWKDNLFKVML